MQQVLSLWRWSGGLDGQEKTAMSRFEGGGKKGVRIANRQPSSELRDACWGIEGV